MWYRLSQQASPSTQEDIPELTLEALLNLLHQRHVLDPSMFDQEAAKGEINLRSNPFAYDVGKSQIPSPTHSSIRSSA